MTALIACEACKREISSAAAACPGCGHPVSTKAPNVVTRRGGWKLPLFGSLVVAGGIVVAVIASNRANDEEAAAQRDRVANSPAVLESERQRFADFIRSQTAADGIGFTAAGPDHAILFVTSIDCGYDQTKMLMRVSAIRDGLTRFKFTEIRCAGSQSGITRSLGGW